MTTGTREIRRQALAGWIATGGFTLHVTAELATGTSRDHLENRIREWIIRVNRRYLGRNWHQDRCKNDRLKGWVFFEQGAGGWHAHMIIKPPSVTSDLHFLLHAPYQFRPHRDRNFQKFYGKAVTAGGKMFAQKIGPDTADSMRVARYDTKDLQYRDDVDASAWKFVEDLTAFKGCR